MAAVGGLEGEALQRQARLKALKQKASGDSDSPAAKRPRDKDNDAEEEEEEEEEERSKPVLKFRNYKPQDDDLKDKQVARVKPPDVGEHVSEQLVAAQEKPVGQVDLLNLAPRKPDWDLKRDIASKLEKLQRRTQRAIVEIVRQRLAEDGGDLSAAVSAAELQ